MSKIYIELEKAVSECKEIADEYGNSKRISDRQTCAGINTAIRVFENIPAADVVEVIRCRDCKFSREDGSYEYNGQAETHLNCVHWLRQNHGTAIVRKDGFCFEAKRKSDND